MNRIVKWTLVLAGTLIILLVAAGFLLPLLFDSEDIKRNIAAEIARQTGRDFRIEGDLEFSVFPVLAVEVNDLRLGNAEGFGAQAFTEIGQARIGVGLLPLLRKQLRAEEIVLSGLRVNLTVNQRGVSNWADLSSGGAPDRSSAGDTTSPFESQYVAGLNIADASIEYRDEQTGDHYRLSGFSLQTGALGARGMVPVEVSMRLEDVSAGTGVALALSADAGFDASAGSFALSGVDMRLDDSQVTGSLTLASLDAGLPSLRFDFDVDQVDLDRYLAPADDSEGGDAQAVAIPQDELAGLDIDGSLRIGQVTAMGMTLTDAEVGLEVKDKVLRLNPLKASFYGGHYDGDIVLDAAGAVPRLSLNERMESVVFAQLGRDFLGYDQVSGAAYGSLKASGSGSTSDAMLKSLRGGLDLRLDEGALEGIDVWHEIRKALAKVKGQPAPEGGTGRTVFSRLSVDASLAGGVLTLDQLIGELPFLKLQGEGSIDLQTQALDIGLVAGVRSVPELSQDPLAADLEGRQVPFRISGAATQPRIAIDLENLLKGEASRALMDKLGLSGSKKADDGGGDQESGEASTEDMARGLLGGLLGGKNDKKEGEGKKDDDG